MEAHQGIRGKCSICRRPAPGYDRLPERPADEFAAGHLPQAINIPLRDLPHRLRRLPKNREVVAYCRGAYCVLAFEAVALLRKRGFTAMRLEDGFPEWRAAGLPVVTPEAW
jgi:ArsR family transcriptional regulator